MVYGRGAAASALLMNLDSRRRDVGVIGDIDVSAGLDSGYMSALQYYADRGATGPAEIISKIQAAYEEAKDLAAKGEDVLADVGIGAALGVELGPFGAAAGAIIGAIYGIIDNFGGDIMAVLNPPDFSEEDYTRFKQKIVAAGGIPNPGVPPDNYEGGIWPDGAMSGGEMPYPGTWNGEIKDQAVYDRYQARDAAKAAGLYVAGPFGLPIPKPPLPLLYRARTALLLKKLNTAEAVRNMNFTKLGKQLGITPPPVVIPSNRILTSILNKTQQKPAPVVVKSTAPVRSSAPPSHLTNDFAQNVWGKVVLGLSAATVVGSVGVLLWKRR